jgi:hypothetical protein
MGVVAIGHDTDQGRENGNFESGSANATPGLLKIAMINSAHQLVEPYHED